MPAARIFLLARTMRWASVASGTRKARAISGVVSPPSVRRVSATLASTARAGWQQVKMSRSRSSERTIIVLDSGEQAMLLGLGGVGRLPGQGSLAIGRPPRAPPLDGDDERLPDGFLGGSVAGQATERRDGSSRKTGRRPALNGRRSSAVTAPQPRRHLCQLGGVGVLIGRISASRSALISPPARRCRGRGIGR
jgi:hypothetical protein